MGCEVDTPPDPMVFTVASISAPISAIIYSTASLTELRLADIEVAVADCDAGGGATGVV